MPEWVDRLVAVNRPGPSKMVVAHLHPGEVSTSFQQSLMGSMAYDRARHRRMFSHDGRLGMIASQSGAGQLDRARNDCVRIFLDEHRDAELLVFVDSDMGWDPEAFERLAATMDDTNIDILGGLCFGQKITGPFAQRAVNTEWFPTLYRWVEDQQAFDTAHEYKPDALVEVAATGAAFVMISRRCLEAIRAAEGDHWFDMIANGDRRFGEDLSFCLRARRNGFKVHVDTGVKASHRKEVWFTEADYRMLRRPSSSAVTVVIPVKDNLHLTRSLVSQLRVQGGYTEILLFDNGSTDPEMIEWLAAQDVAEVFDASGANLHEMWNAGIAEAISRHRGLADVVFLNNDIKVGPLFLQCLVAGLRSSSAQAVSANYDNRPGSGVLPVRGICANRYDGSGGLAGFAFALRAEFIASGYRFPEEMSWWYGDNDLCLSIERAGGWYGVVSDAAAKHLDGGSQTERPAEWDAVVAADRAAFESKWPDVTLVPAGAA